MGWVEAECPAEEWVVAIEEEEAGGVWVLKSKPIENLCNVRSSIAEIGTVSANLLVAINFGRICDRTALRKRLQ